MAAQILTVQKKSIKEFVCIMCKRKHLKDSVQSRCGYRILCGRVLGEHISNCDNNISSTLEKRLCSFLIQQT